MKKRLIDLPQRDIEKYAMKFYKMAHGKSCNIDHPVLFTEKIRPVRVDFTHESVNYY